MSFPGQLYWCCLSSSSCRPGWRNNQWARSEVKASACDAGDLGSVPGLGRSPGGGHGNPLQYSCLENPMDGGAWWATVHGVTTSRTRLSDFTFTHSKSLGHSGVQQGGGLCTLAPGKGMPRQLSNFSLQEFVDYTSWEGQQIF